MNTKKKDIESSAGVLQGEKAVKTVEEAIEALEGLGAFNHFREFVNNLSESDRIKLYNSGAPNLSGKVIGGFIAPVGKTFVGALKYENDFLKVFGENGGADVYRAMVHFGLVEPPEELDKEALIENAKKDTINEKRILKLVGVAISFFAPEFLPQYSAIEKFLVSAHDLRKKVSLEELDDAKGGVESEDKPE